MKFYDDILNSNLSFEVANKLMKNKKQFATRPCWDGFHFYDKNDKYCILLKNGKVDNYTLDDVYDKEKNDWIIVAPTNRAIKLIDNFIK